MRKMNHQGLNNEIKSRRTFNTAVLDLKLDHVKLCQNLRMSVGQFKVLFPQLAAHLPRNRTLQCLVINHPNIVLVRGPAFDFLPPQKCQGFIYFERF